jgi:hypothetical protein
MNYSIKILMQNADSLVTERKRIESVTMYEAHEPETKDAINLINERLKDLDNSINILKNENFKNY